jgi:hypothetical protein
MRVPTLMAVSPMVFPGDIDRAEDSEGPLLLYREDRYSGDTTRSETGHTGAVKTVVASAMSRGAHELKRAGSQSSVEFDRASKRIDKLRVVCLRTR